MLCHRTGRATPRFPALEPDGAVGSPLNNRNKSGGHRTISPKEGAAVPTQDPALPAAPRLLGLLPSCTHCSLTIELASAPPGFKSYHQSQWDSEGVISLPP